MQIHPICRAVWAAEAFGLGWTTSIVAAALFFSDLVSETFSLFFIYKDYSCRYLFLLIAPIY